MGSIYEGADSGLFINYDRVGHGSDTRFLDTRCLFKDHLDTVLQAHALECLLTLQVVLLVDLVEILDFFATFVLLSEVAEISLDLLLSLLDSILYSPGLVLCLVFFHLFDIVQAFLGSWLVSDSFLLESLCYFSTFLLHFANLLHVFQHALFLFLLDSLLNLILLLAYFFSPLDCLVLNCLELGFL